MAKRKSVRGSRKTKPKRRPGRWAPLPQSDADNAFELLADVCIAILEEPLRYDQDIYMATGSNGPACGTVGCVAGWTVALKSTRKSLRELSSIERKARQLLGVDLMQAYELFNADAIAKVADQVPFSEGTVILSEGTLEGTLEYAAMGVHHITQFMIKYAGQLKAHKIPKGLRLP